MSDQSTVQSVERTFTLIELLCKKSMGITELSEASGLHKATVFRLLSTLCSLGYAEKNASTDKYGLTLKYLKLTSSMLSKIDIRRYARPFLEQIPIITGETVHLVQRSGNEIVYIDKFDSSMNSIRMVSRVGLSLPMIYTAVGKAILSHCDDAEIREVWQSTEIIKKTDKTITNFDSFLREINIIRKNGYATDNEENELGVCCIATALADIYGEYCYAFSVSAPVSRINDEKIQEIGQLILKTRNKIVMNTE